MFTTTISHLRGPGIAALLATAALGVVACGDDDDNENSQPAAPPAQGRVLDREPDPDQLTCSEIGNRDNYKITYDTAFSLAEDNPIEGSNTHQAAIRITGAMNDLCERRDNGAYRPAADALAAVKRGEYGGGSAQIP